jgi:FkbM family methyltransferase
MKPEPRPQATLAKMAKSAVRSAWNLLPGKRRLFEMWRGASAPPERIWCHLHFTGEFTVSVGQGVGFRMHHFGQLVENELFWAGYGNGWEGTSLRLWACLAPRARTILDVGANTGVYALAAAARSPRARVFALEPVRRIADRLRHNVALNRLAIEVLEAGASDRTGEATIFEPTTEHHYSASLEQAMLAGKAELRETRIAVTRLDDFAAARQLPRLDLMKVDAEMHELPILDGLGARLAQDRPAILVEVLTPEIGRGLMQRIAGLGYALFRIEEGRALVPVATLAEHRGNHLICPDEEAGRLGISAGVSHEDLLAMARAAPC